MQYITIPKDIVDPANRNVSLIFWSVLRNEGEHTTRRCIFSQRGLSRNYDKNKEKFQLAAP